MARKDGLVSTLLVAGLIGAVAIVFVRSSRFNTTPAVAVPAPGSSVDSPGGAARLEAFRVNEGLPSDPALAAEFEDINSRYLDGRVAATPVRWESRLANLGGAFGAGFRLEGLTNGRMILLNPAIRDDEALRRRTLTHEMVHVMLWHENAGHGPAFQSALRLVATRAPYMGLIASDDEKESLLAQLHTEVEALDREEKALAEERKGLEATDPSTPGLQLRIDAFNQRVRQQQDAADKYNGMVGVYNQMIAYPDGLDGERLATRRR
jgi:hypothetical protein